ncbi:MAG TPA: hypothetical protein VJH20_03570 [Candidatus Nanoarchaeia archaeon]|nr:hypothetical protein [Candidatus Nanoarchaeia archaeon]
MVYILNKEVNKHNNFWKRVLVSLTTGYILYFYSESLFWAWPNPDESILWILVGWLLYSIFAFVFLLNIDMFKANSIWAVFLVGAVYGWLNEGLVAITTYDLTYGLPLNISWTGLAWHAIISVLIGWYYVRKILAENNYKKTIILASLIGFFYGFWAIYWPIEKAAIAIDKFSQQAVFFTLLLIAAHIVYDKVKLTEFKASKKEKAILWAISVLYFVFVTIQTNFLAVLILPALLLLTYFALRHNRKIEKKESALISFNRRIKLVNYLLLLFIPIVAVGIYGMAYILNFFPATNFIVYYITMPLGFILYFVSLFKVFSKP